MENQKISGLLKDGFMVTKPRVRKGVIGNNLGREGLLDSVTISNEYNGIHMSILEGNLEIGQKNEVYIENVVSRGAVDEGDDTLQLHKSHLLRKTGVSDKGINLFVQLLCSQDRNYKSRSNENNSGEDVVRNYLLNQDVESASEKIEGDNVGKQELKFGVGDMVWVKTPNQLWWPGMIRDPSSAAEDTEKYEGTGNFLVKYFGNVNSLWCHCSNLKPFFESFDQMTKQNNTSIFLGSIEKAISEIGRRVKAEMTCPCFLKESQKLESQSSAETRDVNSMSKVVKMGNSDILSLSHFEPSNFLARIRNLGRFGFLPGKIELTIIKSRLSAFYSSVGHCQLPMLQLRPPIGDTSQIDQDSLTRLLMDNGRNNTSEGNRNFVLNGNDDSTLSKLGNVDIKSTLSGKGHESRERKKSKYLSYPYVNVSQVLKTVVENVTEGPKQITPSSDKKTQKKVSSKPFKGPHKISKLDDVKAASAHLLAELRSTALDSFYLKKGRHFDSVKRFYCSFRQFAFLDHEKLENSPEADIFPRKVKKKNQGVKSANVKGTDDSLGTSLNNNTNNSAVIGKQEMGSDVPIKGKTSKKTKMAGATPELPQVNNISFGTSTNDITNDSSKIGGQETGSDVPSKEKTSKKRKKAGATPELSQVNMIDVLLGLDGNNPSFSLEKVPFTGTSTSKGKLVPKRKKEGLAAPNENAVDLMDANIGSFKTAPGLEDVQITIRSNLKLNNGAGVKDGAKFMVAESTARKSEVNMKNAGLGSSVQTSLPVGPLQSNLQVPSQSDSQAECKKRKEKVNAGPVASLMPDLNGDASEPSSLGKDTSELIAVSPDGGKPEPKRRWKNKSDVSGSNVNTNKMSKKEQDLGAILFLNFAPGFPPPSKETLIQIFSRFGLVKESETRVINDSTAQIAYDRKSDGGFACRSLEKSNPLGASLASYNIIFPGTSQTVEEQNGMQSPHPSAPAKACKILAKRPEAPNLIAMRRNIEMMQSVLEKKGDTLSPETKTKLENEIKGFLNKISTIVGSSSS
ncbi:Hypothetical predicted protein [Olea europaea subsp. europaea]|uniref:PWWP domain-containing protein n=1 Tax=Olea europaea subsp. europaea TaxID=158383 RepID=A0A8S0TQT3_OLEEU|nr:Hypothetical predicted protein [Olea europaea subsp. europaea]